MHTYARLIAAHPIVAEIDSTENALDVVGADFPSMAATGVLRGHHAKLRRIYEDGRLGYDRDVARLRSEILELARALHEDTLERLSQVRRMVWNKYLHPLSRDRSRDLVMGLSDAIGTFVSQRSKLPFPDPEHKQRLPAGPIGWNQFPTEGSNAQVELHRQTQRHPIVLAIPAALGPVQVYERLQTSSSFESRRAAVTRTVRDIERELLEGERVFEALLRGGEWGRLRPLLEQASAAIANTLPAVDRADLRAVAHVVIEQLEPLDLTSLGIAAGLVLVSISLSVTSAGAATPALAVALAAADVGVGVAASAGILVQAHQDNRRLTSAQTAELIDAGLKVPVRSPHDLNRLAMLEIGALILPLGGRAVGSAFRRRLARLRTRGVDVKPPDPAAPGVDVKPPDSAQRGIDVKPPDAAAPGVDVKPPDPAQRGVDVKPPDPAQRGMDVKPPDPAQRGIDVKPPDPAQRGARSDANEVGVPVSSGAPRPRPRKMATLVVSSPRGRYVPDKRIFDPNSLVSKRKVEVGANGQKVTSIEGQIGPPLATSHRLQTSHLPGPGKIGLSDAYDRAHLWPWRWGAEVAEGILYATKAFNVSVQRKVEDRVVQLLESLSPGERLMMKATSVSQPENLIPRGRGGAPDILPGHGKRNARRHIMRRAEYEFMIIDAADKSRFRHRVIIEEATLPGERMLPADVIEGVTAGEPFERVLFARPD